MEHLIKAGPDGMADAFTGLFNLAMKLEREQHLVVGRSRPLEPVKWSSFQFYVIIDVLSRCPFYTVRPMN